MSLSCGIDMWFFKVILANYIITILFFLYRLNKAQIIAALTLLHVSFIALCYLYQIPLYWYCSNLAFPLGTIVASINSSQVQRALKPTSVLSVILFGIYYLSNMFQFTKTPIAITGNLALCILLLYSIRLFPTGRRCPWLEYVGRNSLYYYLFSIFVMLCIPGQGLHFSMYFALNVLATTACVWIWTHLLRQ